MLRDYLQVSRMLAAPSLSQKGRGVFLKLESDLPTGAFKVRGALYALAARLARHPIREVTASSTGNHGAGVAFAARQLGVPATIFLPQNPNPIKRARIAALGAKIVESGKDITEACSAAIEYSQSEDVYFLNDTNDPVLPAGPATIAAEIFEQLPTADTIVVPMGDSALIRSVGTTAKLLSPAVKIIGVQAERAPSYFLSWKAGRVIPTDTCDTIADGLATRMPEPENVETIREVVDEVRLVSDEEMLSAIRRLVLDEHIVAEPAGAASIAAILQEQKFPGSQIVAIVSGANITSDVLQKALATA
jgi:threonine dehydratase